MAAFEFVDEAEETVGTAVGFVIRESQQEQPGSEIQRIWIEDQGGKIVATHTSPDTRPNLRLFDLATDSLGG